MKISYFEDTDTLLIERKPGSVVETRDLDEDTLMDLDAQGQVLAITVEHASARDTAAQRDSLVKQAGFQAYDYNE